MRNQASFCEYWIGEAFRAANSRYFKSVNTRRKSEREIAAMFGPRCNRCPKCCVATEVTRPERATSGQVPR